MTANTISVGQPFEDVNRPGNIGNIFQALNGSVTNGTFSIAQNNIVEVQGTADLTGATFELAALSDGRVVGISDLLVTNNDGSPSNPDDGLFEPPSTPVALTTNAQVTENVTWNGPEATLNVTLGDLTVGDSVGGRVLTQNADLVADSVVVGASDGHSSNQIAVGQGVRLRAETVQVGAVANANDNIVQVNGEVDADQVNVGAAGNTGNEYRIGSTGYATGLFTIAQGNKVQIASGGDISDARFDLVDFTNGRIDAQGFVDTQTRLDDTFNFTRNTLGNNVNLTSLEIEDTGRLRVLDDLVYSDMKLVNDGRIDLFNSAVLADSITNQSGGEIRGSGDLIANGSQDGAITNEAGGTILLGGFSTISGDVVNEGVITFSGVGPNNVLDEIENNGTIQVLDGSGVTFQDEYTGAGVIEGGGLVQFVSGVSVGNSPAEVTFDADVSLFSTTVLNIELAGLGTNEFDALLIEGETILGGDLVFSYLDGYLANPGDEFIFLVSDEGITGTFENVVFADSNPDWELVYNTNSLTARIVPEPATGSLLLLAGLSAMWRRTRR